MPELRIEIAGNPPSANHYKSCRVVTPRGGKPFIQWYVTGEGERWYWDVLTAAGGRQLRAPSYVVSYAVFTATARAIDVDNYAKCILDGLTKAGVIEDDRNVTDLHGYRRVDRANPRTLIIVRTTQELLFEAAK